MKPGRMERPKVEVLGEAGSGWIKVTLPDGRVDVYCSPQSKGVHRAGDVEFEGLAALLRLDSDGQLSSWAVVQGQRLRFRGADLK